MTKAGRRRAKLLLTAACFGWIAVSSYVLFSDLPDDVVRHHKSDVVKEKLRDCEGSFRERYDCKEAIVIETSRKTFWNLTERVLFVTIPAVFAGLAGAWIIRRIPEDKPPRPVEDLDWKIRAQRHIANSGMDDHSSGQS